MTDRYTDIPGATRLPMMLVAAACGFAPLLHPATSLGQASYEISFDEATKSSGLQGTFLVDFPVYPNLDEFHMGGSCVADFDGDGDPDVFILGGGKYPDQLYQNDGAGGFTDIATSAGVDRVHGGAGCSTADYDGDGDIDMFVTSFGNPGKGPQFGEHMLYRNNGDGTFTDVAGEAGLDVTSFFQPNGYGSCWGDYDLDGDLDLCVAGWDPADMCNRLFRNEGDGTFADVTIEATGSGLMEMYGFQPAFADMDGDGWPDLLVAGDIQTSRYLANNGDGTFFNATPFNGTGIDDNGMGQAILDFDGDGLFDWYVSSIHLEFPYIPTVPGTGNMLYRNLGNHMYEEVSVPTGVNDGGWGWGAIGVDLDQDGRIDLVEVNGWPAVSFWQDEPAKVYQNMGSKGFVDVGVSCGIDSTRYGRGLIAFDAEGDGDMDLLINNFNDQSEFFRNNAQDEGGHWLQVRLDSSTNPMIAPGGLDAIVSVTAAGKTQKRINNGQPSYLCTMQVPLHFGLGSARIIDEIRILWPRGIETVLVDVPVDQVLDVQAPVPGDIDADGRIDGADLAVLLAMWGEVTSFDQLIADLNSDGIIDGLDLAKLLAGWSR